MDFTKINELNIDDIILRKITENDKQFIADMFTDKSILKYYIVPKEASQDYRNLISYFMNDFTQRSGFSWIIIKKGDGLFSKNKACGFIAFEFRNNLENARISYALRPEFRGKGIVTRSVSLVIEALKSLGVKSIEADVDNDNLSSEKIVEKLGFTTNKKQVLVDPEMMREGEIRTRFLWKKELSSKSNYISDATSEKIEINAPLAVLISQINNIISTIKTKGEQPKLVARYFYLLGRINFIERNYEKAIDAFGKSNMIITKEGLPENHEIFYWYGRMREIDNKIADAKMYYGFALENFNGDPNLISRGEIQNALNKLS